MSTHRRLLFALLAVSAAVAIMPEIAATITPAQKEAAISARRRADVRALLSAAGVPQPTRLLLRAFKGDGRLELWARGSQSDVYRLVKTYAICSSSGNLGPKRREGDGQVPEGVYRVNHFNPASTFHLSMGINYPNQSDKILTTDPKNPGSNIYIHGSCVTIGCIPMGDENIEEIYLAGREAGDKVDVHIFPCRITSPDCRTQMATMTKGRPELLPFWQDLDRIQAAFDRDHKLPAVSVDAAGRYVLAQR